ncbi:MAG: FIST C-terminal domain-containing protein [Flavobacteriales bacterium]|nr:FIST C-terminal domain-containing protein [Flavobacteriales bacterium]
MKIDQHIWKSKNDILNVREGIQNKSKTQLVLAFGDRMIFEKNDLWFYYIKNLYPNAEIISSTSAGEIADGKVFDNTISITAICFEKTKIKAISVNIDDENINAVGKRLITKIKLEGLKHVFLLSSGMNMNGDDLIDGINNYFPEEVSVTGGIAGDGERHEKTLVGLNALPIENNVVAIGFYGTSLTIKHGIHKGWIPFGPKRLITKSFKNKLYELDGKNALSIYKKYLGDKASELPGSAFLFPLGVYADDQPEPIIRTILTIDEKEQSMTFAGNLKEGNYVQLMTADLNELVYGSYDTALNLNNKDEESPELIFIVSCIGRKIVLGEGIGDEIENIVDATEKSVLAGFYSYGEFAPPNNGTKCCLHNETLVITTFFE